MTRIEREPLTDDSTEYVFVAQRCGSRTTRPRGIVERCPFCPNTDLDAHVVFCDDLVLFVQDERYQDALKHAGVIVPVRHVETVFDLDEPEVVATFRMLAVVKGWIDECFAPDGYNVGWNCGAIAGQSIAHAHLHVMPRFRQEPLAGKGIRALLKSDANAW